MEHSKVNDMVAVNHDKSVLDWLNRADETKVYTTYTMPTHIFDWAYKDLNSKNYTFKQAACCAFVDRLKLEDLYLSLPTKWDSKRTKNRNGEDASPVGWNYPENYATKDRNGTDMVEAYLTWVLGDSSPYKSMSHHSSVIRNTDGVIIGLGFNNLIDLNPSFFVNWMIAVRAVIEQPFKVETWYTLVNKYGVCPTLAMYLSHLLRMDGPVWNFGWRYTTHYQLNQEAGLKKLYDGPTLTKGSFKKGVSYKPCNSIWDGEDRFSFISKLMDKHTTKINSRFGYHAKHITPDQLKIVLKEIEAKCLT